MKGEKHYCIRKVIKIRVERGLWGFMEVVQDVVEVGYINEAGEDAGTE